MTGDTAIGIALPGTAGAAAPDPQSSSDAVAQRVKAMAQEFEALLMTQMLRQMRQAILSDEDDDNGLGKDTMTDTIDIELGGVLSRAGGFGLANALSKAMARRLGVDSSPQPSTSGLNGVAPLKQPPAVAQPPIIEPPAVPASADSTAAGTAAPAADTLPAGSLEVPRGRVSSAFGWRPDPFNGVARFHSGIDVAQAYGRDVRAAAGGRVAFTGDRGAYGTTIMVEHPGGRQTLYAHLSASDVRVGDLVESGQVIGKSGNSGRSTGPHLHFEVLDGGHPVDPDVARAGRIDGQQTWTTGD